MKIKGFTIVEIMITVAILSMLLAIAMPNLVRMRENATEDVTEANLKALYGAIQIYYNNHQIYPTSFSDLRDYIDISKFEDRFEINPSLNQ